MPCGHRFDIALTHHVDVSKAVQLLLHHLACDHWYVACHHDQLFVYHLTKAGVDYYAACFQCTPPQDKGIYHGSKAWSLSLIPLKPEQTLDDALLKGLGDSLAALN